MKKTLLGTLALCAMLVGFSAPSFAQVDSDIFDEEYDRGTSIDSRKGASLVKCGWDGGRGGRGWDRWDGGGWGGRGGGDRWDGGWGGRGDRGRRGGWDRWDGGWGGKGGWDRGRHGGWDRGRGCGNRCYGRYH